jgi:CheY-like chemotaxis protein
MKAPRFKSWFARRPSLNPPQRRQVLDALHPAAGLDQVVALIAEARAPGRCCPPLWQRALPPAWLRQRSAALSLLRLRAHIQRPERHTAGAAQAQGQMAGVFASAARFTVGAQMADAVMVALSGYGQPQDLAASQTAGFSRHLVKPVDIPYLLALLDTLAPDPGAMPA